MTHLELRDALSVLAGLRSDAEPILTLYLDTHWADEKKRELARVFLQDASKRAIDRHAAHPQLEALRRMLGRVEAEAADRVRNSGAEVERGLAVFACEALGLWRVLESPRPFRNELCVDARPHLLQLARVAGDVEPALMASVHAKGIRVYEMALGAIVSETSIEGVTPGKHAEGASRRAGPSPSPHGPSGGASFEREQKDQRHLEEQVQRVWREAAAHFTALFDRDPRQNVVLVGTATTVADFERLLPERMRERVRVRLPRPPGKASWRGNGKNDLVQQAAAKLRELERASEAVSVERAIGEAMRGGLAVLGPEDVVLAVNERRVHRLILEEDFAGSGWRCRNCGALGTTHDERCSFCQGPLARVDALGEELLGRVLTEDGDVEVVAHTNRLHSYAGVAALLRQARARGLSGRDIRSQ